MQNNDRWKRHRKWFQHGFQVKRRLDEYIPIQQRETRRLLVDLSEDSEAFMDHFKRWAQFPIHEPDERSESTIQQIRCSDHARDWIWAHRDVGR